MVVTMAVFLATLAVSFWCWGPHRLLLGLLLLLGVARVVMVMAMERVAEGVA